MKDSSTFELIDILAREYGWTIEYIQNLGMDELENILSTILQRRRNEYQTLLLVINHAIAGKKLNWEDTSNEGPANEEKQLLDLMSKLKTKVVKNGP